MRHETSRQARAGCAAAHARASTVCVRGRQPRPGARAPLADQRRRRVEAGVPRNTVKSDETPKRIRHLARCSVRRKRRVVAEFGIAHHRRDGESRRRGPGAAASAPIATSGANAHRRRESARASAARGVSHASGRYNVAPSIHARVPVHSATVTAVWQFAILPRAPQYCRATPTEAGPLFGKAGAVEDQDARSAPARPLATASRPLGLPRRMRDEMLKALDTVPGSLRRAHIASIDLRRLSLSRPVTYRRNAPRWTRARSRLRTAPATSATGAATRSRCRSNTAAQRIGIRAKKYNALKSDHSTNSRRNSSI